GRAVDVVAETKRAEKHVPNAIAEPELFRLGYNAILFETDRAAARLVRGREQQDVVRVREDRRVDVQVVTRIVRVRPEHRSSRRVEPVNRAASKHNQLPPSVDGN